MFRLYYDRCQTLFAICLRLAKSVSKPHVNVGEQPRGAIYAQIFLGVPPGNTVPSFGNFWTYVIQMVQIWRQMLHMG